MNIESRLPAVALDLPAGGNSTAAASRQRSVTSSPSGTSTREPEQSLETSAKKQYTEISVDVATAVEKLNKLLESQKKDVTFSVDEQVNTTVIKFFKHETGELIKQIPPEEILAMAAKIKQNLGLIVDNTV